MRIKKTIAGVTAAAAALAGGVALATPAQAKGSEKSLVESLLDRNRGDSTGPGELDAQKRFANWFDHDILIAAVLANASLGGNGATIAEQATETGMDNLPITLFAPTDGAFRALVYEITGEWLSSEQDVLNAVVGVTVTDTPGLLDVVLSYHVVAGEKLLLRDLLRTPVVDTLAGESFERKGLRLQDNEPDARDPRVVRPNVDRFEDDALHVINRVLIPADVEFIS